ncbi:MAG TPA: group I intron-associated PD-(D/E)XK endonuclease [Candidatus Omnitrophota bacterium]|mgnify:CR=1 FL=1|nr:group I intron-associated PD-(D/E)XK endonuclease [Candidatus Omnitrophota bacterium]
MDTKLKADIAEAAVITMLLKRGFNVLQPVGDRLPYDLAVDINGKLLRIQVKSAWLYNGSYTVDTRRTKTNRRQMRRSRYDGKDFDFAILYIDRLSAFYVMPVSVFANYKSGISLVERKTRQRKPQSATYKDRWDLLSAWAVQPVTAE